MLKKNEITFLSGKRISMAFPNLKSTCKKENSAYDIKEKYSKTVMYLFLRFWNVQDHEWLKCKIDCRKSLFWKAAFFFALKKLQI